MPTSEARWLPLSEAATRWYNAGHPWHAIDDILKSGRVRLSGKRGRFDAEPLEQWLPRVKWLEINTISNEVTLHLDLVSADEREVARQLDRSYTGNFPIFLQSDVTFTEVRLRWPDLAEESDAAGYRLGNQTNRKAQPEKRSDDGPAGRRGPKPGTLRRYETKDRELFPDIDRLMQDESISASKAALELAEKGKVAGVGTPQSRAKRLANLYLVQAKRAGAESPTDTR